MMSLTFAGQSRAYERGLGGTSYPGPGLGGTGKGRGAGLKGFRVYQIGISGNEEVCFHPLNAGEDLFFGEHLMLDRKTSLVWFSPKFWEKIDKTIKRWGSLKGRQVLLATRNVVSVVLFMGVIITT